MRVTIVNAAGIAQADVRFELKLPDGKVETGTTDQNGLISFKDLPTAGDCKLVLPDIDASEKAKENAS